MKFGPITVNRWNIAVIHPGSRSLRPFAFCVGLGSSRLDPSFAGYVGDPNDPQGWTHRIAYLFRRDNGFRHMRAVFGGTHPQPLRWF